MHKRLWHWLPVQQQVMHKTAILTYTVGHKNWTCLSVDNSATVSGRSRVTRQKFQNAVKKLTTNLHSKAFKYSLPNLHKYLSPPIFCQI